MANPWARPQPIHVDFYVDVRPDDHVERHRADKLHSADLAPPFNQTQAAEDPFGLSVPQVRGSQHLHITTHEPRT